METIIQWNCQAFSNISYLREMLSISEAEPATDSYSHLTVTSSTICVHGLDWTTQYVRCCY